MVTQIGVLCVIMKCYHKHPSKPPVSGFLRYFVLEFLSYAVCIRSRKIADNKVVMVKINGATSGHDVEAIQSNEEKVIHHT